jgi:hypothetical protein
MSKKFKIELDAFQVSVLTSMLSQQINDTVVQYEEKEWRNAIMTFPLYTQYLLSSYEALTGTEYKMKEEIKQRYDAIIASSTN